MKTKPERLFLLISLDKSFSYTDATTFTVMERLRIANVLAFDQHFVQYGFNPLTLEKQQARKPSPCP